MHEQAYCDVGFPLIDGPEQRSLLGGEGWHVQPAVALQQEHESLLEQTHMDVGVHGHLQGSVVGTAATGTTQVDIAPCGYNGEMKWHM